MHIRILVAAALAVLAALPTPASAAGGGTFAGFPPVVSGFQCRTGCAGIDVARAGSVVRVTGDHLDAAALVTFLGGSHRSDDVRARPLRTHASWLEVRVPAHARTGPLAVTSHEGQTGRSRDPLALYDGSGGASGARVDVRVTAKRVYFAGRRRARVTYLVRGSQPAQVRIDLVRASDGTAIASWSPGMVAPGATHTVTWNGKSGRRVPASGRYRFRVVVGGGASAPNGGGATVARGGKDGGAFMFLRNIFPIRGWHGYGGGAGRFGAARKGHRHQGQDVFAHCGTPLAAARGGRVKYVGSQSAAGNYIVMDPAGTGYDYVYMHLRERALVRKGQRIYTGQLVGHVGDTGDAQGCHLHFELWTQPGWYSGGHPIDPLATLRSWDRVS